MTLAIQRVASEQTAESVVSVLHLPSDDMKGRIIGREGRNIRSFEQVTGVNLIIDDTPEAVLLSCFDPVRREIARLTLEELISDGRIHPSRIEEVHGRSGVEVERLCIRAGEDAALEMGITDLHPQLVVTLGRLRYRTSYGQNVLRHLVESGHAAGMLADELGLDRAACVRGAFLHDIGHFALSDRVAERAADGCRPGVPATADRGRDRAVPAVRDRAAPDVEVRHDPAQAGLDGAGGLLGGERPLELVRCDDDVHADVSTA